MLLSNGVNKMTTLFIDTDAIQSALQDAALELQARYQHEDGETYRLEDLQKALTHWLEVSIESLAEEALFHTAEGDRSCAFNRDAFELQMRRVKPIHPPRVIEGKPIYKVNAA